MSKPSEKNYPLSNGWSFTGSNDEQGRVVDDSEVLMVRPDGQPAPVQAQYVKYYEAKGFKIVDDPLDLADVIPASLQVEKKPEKAELRKIRDEKRQQTEDDLKAELKAKIEKEKETENILKRMAELEGKQTMTEEALKKSDAALVKEKDKNVKLTGDLKEAKKK